MANRRQRQAKEFLKQEKSGFTEKVLQKINKTAEMHFH